MTTDLEKPVKRRADTIVRDAGKPRRLVVTLYPSGDIGLRPEGTRREEFYPLEAIYYTAIKARVASEKAKKAAAKQK